MIPPLIQRKLIFFKPIQIHRFSHFRPSEGGGFYYHFLGKTHFYRFWAKISATENNLTFSAQKLLKTTVEIGFEFPLSDYAGRKNFEFFIFFFLLISPLEVLSTPVLWSARIRGPWCNSRARWRSCHLLGSV